MVDLKITNNPTYVNYSWLDKIKGRSDRLQQIAIESTGAKNRGNYVVRFDTLDSLASLTNCLANYYFSETIARLEIEAWAKTISKTVNDKIIDIEESNKLIIEDNPIFTATQIDKLLKFKSGFKITIFCLNAVSKTDLFIIDNMDLFPRHYLYAGNRSKECDRWIDVRKQEKILY